MTETERKLIIRALVILLNELRVARVQARTETRKQIAARVRDIGTSVLTMADILEAA